MEFQVCADADRRFGPKVPSECRGGSDFTVLFEEIFFSFLPAVALVFAALIRLWDLRHRKVIAFEFHLQLGKQCVAISYAITRLAILVLWAIPSSYRTRLSITTAAFDLISCVYICILSYVEGRNTIRPSALLNFYLLVTTLFDVVRLRTLWLLKEQESAYTGLHNIAIASSVSIGLKVILLILEATTKRIVGSSLSPEEKSGIYSLRTFWWLNPILWLGRRKSLNIKDLFPIDTGLKTETYSSHLAETWNKADTSSKYALLRAVLSTLKWPLIAPAFPRLILIGFTYAQPLLIKRAINFVEKGGSEDIGYGLIGATVIIYIGLGILNGYYGHLLYRSITIVRGSLIDIIYNKSLRIDIVTAQEATPAGLITADVERIDFTIEKIHSLWASVIELVVAVFLLEREVGWACIAPVLVAFVCTYLTSVISKVLPTRQKTWNQSIQKRVALTSTMLSNMKTVKMMGLSKYIATTLQAARMTELAASQAFRQCMAIVNVLVLVPKQLSAPFTFLLFVFAIHRGSSNGAMSASRAFTTLTIIELITTPIGLVLQTIPSVTTSLACLDRIQTYLKSPDKIDRRGAMRSSQDSKSSNSEKYNSAEKDLSVIYFRNASFAYKATEDLVLDSISLTIPRGSLTMVVGPVGSGKSTLLKSILGELELRTGEIDVRVGSIAYCDQSPWIANGSIQDCIIGTSKFDEDWFKEVLHVCGLDEDIHSLSEGRHTALGSRGIAFSEGQRQRLALARGVYSRAPLLILDDIFRSLDSKTAGHIFQRLFSPDGLVKRTNLTAVCATHSARHLSASDQVVVLKNGGISEIGSFQYLKEREGYIQSLTTRRQSIGHGNSAPQDNKTVEIKAQRTQPTRKPQIPAPRVIGTRDQSVYIFYLKPIGVMRAVILLMAVISLAFATRFQRIWVQWWTEEDSHHSMYIGVYFLLAVGACLSFAFFFWWMWMFVVPMTAGGLHEQLLDSIINAPLSYFTKVDAGTILNRFSQDMAILNGQLPVNIFQALSILMICLIQIAFIAYGSSYLASAIPVTLLVVFLLSRYYLLTSQQLRLLDIELKAPIYTSLTETKEGLATIRAFGWQSSYKKKCQARIDESKRAIYLLFMIQRWLNFVLDLIVAGLATLLMTLATQLRQSTNPAALGVGLSSLIAFSLNVSQFIYCYTELENSLGAISRIKDCVENIEVEDSATDAKEPPEDWPPNGSIEFSHVTASYNDDEETALNDISFNALPGQKVCICGRTGSGKSTLMSVILRLLSAQTGEVSIDGIDIATLRSEAVRQNINVIPQSPFFLPGSVKLNLSADHHTDEDMTTALEKVGLWGLIESRGGLSAEISAVALSHGQQQLFCLASAMLKKSKIVLIDEATSGVDDETENKMYDLIHEEFRDCTVISIAHRLDRVLEYDQVVVLSHGRCIENGAPGDLLEKQGEFWKLVNP
ncbi:hypothetical protein HYFRA_00006243 [Hymenoscyphus fraxineus]|uniref:Uncharacterized protein n=1 Tax=Hymenoscyphus fraxineus TaxID=746836 RepID=A0A9N9Q025_9HELO|nr:hypothetical protein HYFRA_00006243 [Hymenoscyphus fraxineus]